LGTYQCYYTGCDFERDNKWPVIQHIQYIHLNKSQISCSDCDQKFWGQSRLMKHRLSVHKQVVKYLKCDWNECRFKCKELKVLNMHKIKHFDENVVKNKIIDNSLAVTEVSLSPKTTGNELETINRNINSDSLVSVEIMDICLDKVSVSEPKLSQSIKINLKQTVDKEITSTQTQNNEINLSHEFNCDWNGCHFGTNSCNSFRNHLRRHKFPKLHKCNQIGCLKSFFTSFELIRHMKSHFDWTQLFDKGFEENHSEQSNGNKSLFCAKDEETVIPNENQLMGETEIKIEDISQKPIDTEVFNEDFNNMSNNETNDYMNISNDEFVFGKCFI
jgi:hypothetical protein